MGELAPAPGHHARPAAGTGSRPPLRWLQQGWEVLRGPRVLVAGQLGRKKVGLGWLSYPRWEVTASVPAGPGQAADYIKHLELKLEMRRCCWCGTQILSHK